MVYLLLSASLLLSIIFIIYLYNKNIGLLLKKNISSFVPGDKAILKYKFETTDINPKIKFDVIYEVEIMDQSNSHVKIKAISFTSDEIYALNNKSVILDFMKEMWIPIKDVEKIIDCVTRRDDKLNKILS